MENKNTQNRKKLGESVLKTQESTPETIDIPETINEVYLSKKSIKELIDLLKKGKEIKDEKILEEVSYEIIKRTQSDSLTLEDCFDLLEQNEDGINMFLLSSNVFVQKYIDTNNLNLKEKIRKKIESIANMQTDENDEVKKLIKYSALLFLSNTNNKNNFEVLETKTTYGSGGIIKEINNNINKKITTNNLIKETNKSSYKNNFDLDKKRISDFIRKISGLK